MTYDDAERLLRTDYPEGNAKTQDYDARSNVVRSCAIPKSRAGMACDTGSGDIATTTVYVEGSTILACSNPITCNEPASETDSRGYVTRYTWDSGTGLPTKVETALDGSFACALSGGSCPEVDLTYTPYTGLGSVGGGSASLDAKDGESRFDAQFGFGVHL